MIKKGVNPFVFTNTDDRFYDKYRSHFNGYGKDSALSSCSTTRLHLVVVSKLTQIELCKEEYIVSTFKNRIHYSLEDFECTSNCSDDCTDSMARYRIYEGSGLPNCPNT